MSFDPQYFDQSFNTLREHWEKTLLAELKLPEIGNKGTKKSLNGMAWPTLSLEAKVRSQIPVAQNWKKASQSYIRLDEKILSTQLIEDLDNGVRNFFFEKDFLTDKTLAIITATLEKFPQSDELEIFLLGLKDLPRLSSKLRIYDENDFAIGRTAHDHGGNIIQELGLLGYCIIRKLDRPSDVLPIAVFVDSNFFASIAKVRAAKLIQKKIFEEARCEKKSFLIALTSYREWTLYERYSNMLRNDASVAAAFIGGADHTQSSGYQALFELENLESQIDHTERSYRMARNTSHILALESMLGVVEDAAFGSYHLENLTQYYAQEAWKYMQKLLGQEGIQAIVKLDVSSIKDARLEQVRTRKHVLAGMNDFPDVKERLNLKTLPQPRFFRIAQEFESLRFKMEGSAHRPRVYVAMYGDYAALNARFNFVKNYFELLGLEVVDPHVAQTDVQKLKFLISQRQEEIIVLCALDNDYPALQDVMASAAGKDQFIAGRYEMAGLKNLFAGQNVCEVLNQVVMKWGMK